MFHTHKAKEASIILQWQQFQDMATQLAPSIGAILLAMTSQGWKNALQTSRPTHIEHGSRDTVHRYFLSVAMILCNKMDFSFGVNMAGFCRASHIAIKITICFAYLISS